MAVIMIQQCHGGRGRRKVEFLVLLPPRRVVTLHVRAARLEGKLGGGEGGERRGVLGEFRVGREPPKLEDRHGSHGVGGGQGGVGVLDEGNV